MVYCRQQHDHWRGGVRGLSVAIVLRAARECKCCVSMYVYYERAVIFMLTLFVCRFGSTGPLEMVNKWVGYHSVYVVPQHCGLAL